MPDEADLLLQAARQEPSEEEALLQAARSEIDPAAASPARPGPAAEVTREFSSAELDQASGGMMGGARQPDSVPGLGRYTDFEREGGPRALAVEAQAYEDREVMDRAYRLASGLGLAASDLREDPDAARRFLQQYREDIAREQPGALRAARVGSAILGPGLTRTVADETRQIAMEEAAAEQRAGEGGVATFLTEDLPGAVGATARMLPASRLVGMTAAAFGEGALQAPPGEKIAGGLRSAAAVRLGLGGTRRLAPAGSSAARTIGAATASGAGVDAGMQALLDGEVDLGAVGKGALLNLGLDGPEVLLRHRAGKQAAQGRREFGEAAAEADTYSAARARSLSGVPTNEDVMAAGLKTLSPEERAAFLRERETQAAYEANRDQGPVKEETLRRLAPEIGDEEYEGWEANRRMGTDLPPDEAIQGDENLRMTAEEVDLGRRLGSRIEELENNPDLVRWLGGAQDKQHRAEPKGPTLSQFIRSKGGINTGGELRGEARRLSKKETGVPGLTRSLKGHAVEAMQQAAIEDGYPVRDMTPEQFLTAAEMDATKRAIMRSAQSHDYAAEADASERARFAQEEARYAEQEDSPRPKRVGLGSEGGALNIGPLADAAKGLGRFASETAGWSREAFGEITNLVRGKAGGKGDALAEDILKARDESIRYEAKVREPLTDARRAITRKAADWYQERAYKRTASGVEYAPSRLAEVVEGRLAAPPEAQAADAALDRYLRDAWNVKASLGHKKADGTPLRPYSGRTRTLPRADTGDFRAMVEKGSGADFQAAMEAIADHNGRTVKDVTDKFLRDRDAMLTEHPDAAEVHLSSEFTRDLRIPGAIKVNGREIALQETNPRLYIDKFHAENSAGVGMDAVFGQGPDSTVAKRRKDFIQAGGDPKDFIKVMRAGHGLTPGKTERSRSSALSTARTATQRIMGLGRALTQTGSPAWNASEFLAGNAADAFGVVNSLKGAATAARDLVTRAFTGKHSGRVQRQVQRGLKTEDVQNWTRDIDASNLGQALDDASRALMQPARMVEEGQETQAITAGEERLGGAMKGGGKVSRESSIQDLMVVSKASRQEVADFLDGKMTPDQANALAARFLNRAAPATVGSNQSASQKSQFQQHWLTKLLLKFSQYPSTNIRYTAERLRVAANAIRGKDVPQGERLTAAAVGLGKGLRHAGLRSVQGSLSTLVIQALFGKEGATEEEAAKFQENPGAWLAENAAFAILAGPFAGVARSIWGDRDLSNAIYPLKLVRDVVKPQLKEGRGAGTDAMETVERLVPVVNAFTDRRNTLEREPREGSRGLGRSRRGDR